MMRAGAAVAILLLASPARTEEEWAFAFGNGDRVRGGFAGMRNGTVLVAVPAAPRAVAVPFAEIATAEPAPRAPEAPAPRPAAQLLRLRDGGALLGRCLAIRQGKIEFDVESIGKVTIPGRDVAELLPAEDAVRAFHRSMAEPPSETDRALAPERFDALWTYLGRPDGNLALQAHRDLVRAGGVAVPLLGARLKVQPDAPSIVTGWIRALDADSADVRLLAHARLRALGRIAEPHLKAARERTSAEARQRIAALLALLAAEDPGNPPGPDPEVVRFLRAIRVLETIGTSEARSVLEGLSQGAPDAPTGREAQAALERLRRVR